MYHVSRIITTIIIDTLIVVHVIVTLTITLIITITLTIIANTLVMCSHHVHLAAILITIAIMSCSCLGSSADALRCVAQALPAAITSTLVR